MSWLPLILTVMSFTVTSKNSVTAEGTWPYSMEAVYSCTYQKGQVRQGDTATIVVTGLGGITIERMEVEMKSNKNSGAGKFVVKANGIEVGQKDIAGLTDEYKTVDLEIAPQAGVNELEVMLIGTQNSLYINKYIFSYTPSAPKTVTLMCGNETLDVLTGSEVTLPAQEDEGDWHFVGWTDAPFYVKNEPLNGLISAGTYLPTTDITLWAVYEYLPDWQQQVATELQDGVYIYADTTSGQAMQGRVQNSIAESAEIDQTDLMQRYEVQFDEEGLATIRLAYVYGESYIGYSGTKLVNTPSRWKVLHDGRKTAFYTTVNEKTYILLPGMLQYDHTSDSYYPTTQLVYTKNIEQTSTVLIATEQSITLTCYPEIGFGVETVNDKQEAMCGEWYIPFGNYRMIIKDGKKTIQVW